MKKRNAAMLLLFLALISCGGDKSAEVKKYDISYGNDERNKLDIYLPARRTDQTPFLIFLHGGGWTEGDKGDMNLLQDMLMTRGVASASINYRFVSSSVHVADLMADITSAINYCQSHAKEWNIRTDKYLLGGYSAGGHMALLYGYRYNDDRKVAAVISAAGPTDLADVALLGYAAFEGMILPIENLVGAIYVEGETPDAKFEEASPIWQINNVVPTLLIHGTMDDIVFYDQSFFLSQKLHSKGIDCKLVTIDDAGHNLNLIDPSTRDTIVGEIVTWAQQYGK